MAQGILDRATGEQRTESREALCGSIEALEAERSLERSQGGRAFSRAKELTSLRTKLRTLESRDGFKGNSTVERAALLYRYLGLPEMRHRKTGSLTTDEASVNELYLRLKKGSIKAKGVSREEAMRVCRALIATSVWSKWRTGPLTPKGATDLSSDSFDTAEDTAETATF
jgi:hypothetical protein